MKIFRAFDEHNFAGFAMFVMSSRLMQTLLIFVLLSLFGCGASERSQHAPQRTRHHSHFRPSYLSIAHDHAEASPARDLPIMKASSSSSSSSLTVQVIDDDDSNCLSSSSCTVLVSWSSIESPSATDWLGVYAPSSSSTSDYIDYAYNSKAATDANATFTVTNMRDADGIQFRYIRTTVLGYQVIAVSNNIVFNKGVPLQIRLAFCEEQSEKQAQKEQYDDEYTYTFCVSWNSDTSAYVPVVSYYTSLTSPSSAVTVTGTTHTYTAADMCNSPANITSVTQFRNPGYFHTVQLTLTVSLSTAAAAIQPVTLYYTVGQNEVFSRQLSFTLPPPPTTIYNTYNNTFTLLMLADHGAVNCFRTEQGCKDAPSTVNLLLSDINNLNASLVLHVGDISYAVGYGYLWDMHGALIEHVSSRVPYMVTVGNHEYDHTGTSGNDPSHAPPTGWHPSWGNYGSDSGGECGVPTANRFTSPSSPSSNSVFWYSFSSSLVHFIQLSAEHDFTQGSPQRQFLIDDLANINQNREKIPFVIVNVHRPMYSSENYAGDYEVSLHIQSELEDILYDAEVDLVLAGHYHAYERSCPVYRASCCVSGSRSCPVHIVAGMAGIGLDAAGWMGAPWSLARDEVHFGYLRLSVSVNSDAGVASLSSSFISSSNDDSYGNVIDSVVIEKPYTL